MNRDGTLFLPGVDAPHVYVRAWALGCFQFYQYSNLWEGADRLGGQLRGDKACPFSGVTKSGRVWRKVPESDARSVGMFHTPSIAFRHVPQNSARFGYATERARTLHLRAAVHRRRQRPPKGLVVTEKAVEAT